jgi:hypothetical protein
MDTIKNKKLFVKKQKEYRQNFHTSMIYFSSIGYNSNYNFKNFSKDFNIIHWKPNNNLNKK